MSEWSYLECVSEAYERGAFYTEFSAGNENGLSGIGWDVYIGSPQQERVSGLTEPMKLRAKGLKLR